MVPALKNLQLADPDLGGLLDMIISSVDSGTRITKDFSYLPEAKLAITKKISGGP